MNFFVFLDDLYCNKRVYWCIGVKMFYKYNEELCFNCDFLLDMKEKSNKF